MKREDVPAASAQCANAGVYMMKFMDGELSEKDAAKLRDHLEQCPACKADYMLYDFILESLTQDAGLVAPCEGFTKIVMNKISALPLPIKALEATRNRLAKGILVACSILFGLAFILVVYQEQIMGYLSSVTGLSGYIAVITPVTARIFEIANGTLASVGNFFMAALELFAGYKYLFFGVFLLLLGCQFVIFRYRSGRHARSRAVAGKK